MKELKLNYPEFFKQFKEDISIYELIKFFDSKEIMIEINVDFTRLSYGMSLFCWNVTNFRTLVILRFQFLERSREDAILKVIEEILKQKWI